MEKVDFKKITLEFMKQYIEENAPEDKAWFKEVAFEERKKKVAVPVFNPDGSPCMYQVRDKQKQLKFDNSGKPIMRQKVVFEEIEDSEKTSVFNLLKAKLAFCDKYMPEIVPEAKPKKPTANELLKDW